MSQPLLIPNPPAGDVEVPPVVQDRVASTVRRVIEGMRQVKTTVMEETIMPGFRFSVEGFDVRIDRLRMTVTRPKGLP